MKRILVLLMAIVTFLASQASVASGEKFDDAKFEAQLSSGKPVLVVVHAPWCPTCRAQSAVLNDLFANDTYKTITYLIVDFDSQKEVLKKFNISRQSTLVVYKKGKEVARSIGATSSSVIEAQLGKAF